MAGELMRNDKRSGRRLIPLVFLMILVNLIMASSHIIAKETSTSDTSKQIYIEANKIIIKEKQESQVVLSIEDLPKDSAIAKGMRLGRDRFSSLSKLSPDGNFIAFAVEGFHGWSGLYDLDQKK